MTLKSFLYAGVMIPICAHLASAGGVEGSTQSVGFLFEKGNYAEFAISKVSPSISGRQAVPTNTLDNSVEGTDSGNMALDQIRPSAALKLSLNEQWDIGFSIDTPVIAKIEYDENRPYFFAGTNADLSSTGFTALAKYKLNQNLSLYGGFQHQTVKGSVTIATKQVETGNPASGGSPASLYNLDAESDGAFGVVLGIGYEDPSKAQLVNLTYRSKVTHDFDAEESDAFSIFVSGVGDVPAAPTRSGDENFKADVPQSLTLDWRTGISKEHQLALFGRLRWVEWSEFRIEPEVFAQRPTEDSITSFSDSLTFQIGLAKRFNENWTGSIRYGTEKSSGDFVSNLAPVDGYHELAVAAIYTNDNVKITSGIAYQKYGDAKTELRSGTKLADFSDNSVIAAGVSVGFYF